MALHTHGKTARQARRAAKVSRRKASTGPSKKKAPRKKK